MSGLLLSVTMLHEKKAGKNAAKLSGTSVVSTGTAPSDAHKSPVGGGT